MNDERFDKLAKAAGEGSLHRRLRKGVIGGIAGALLAGSAVGAASGQEVDEPAAPDNGNVPSFVGQLLSQFGISFGNGGIDVDAGDVSVGVSDGDIDIQAPGLVVSIDDGDITIILS